MVHKLSNVLLLPFTCVTLDATSTTIIKQQLLNIFREKGKIKAFEPKEPIKHIFVLV